MIVAALDAGVTASWVTGDEAYGQDPQLRARLERIDIGYVMAVACFTRVRINRGRFLPYAQMSSPTACPPLPGSGTAPEPERRARASTTRRGSTPVPVSIVTC